MSGKSAAPPAGRRERAKADKRARILAAADELLSEAGYEAMTMAKVAQTADVAAGTVFQYAATKPELLMMVTAHRWSATLPAITGRVGRERSAASAVKRLLEPLVSSAFEDPDLSMAVARELLFGAPGPHRCEVVELVAQLEQAIAEVLRRFGATDKAESAARLIVSGGLLELNRTRTGRATADSVQTRISDLVDIVLDGVS